MRTHTYIGYQQAFGMWFGVMARCGEWVVVLVWYVTTYY
jgi:hypothetical protein